MDKRVFPKKNGRKLKYTEKQKSYAVIYHLAHQWTYSQTVRMLGYSNKESLRQWCHELAPKECKKRGSVIEYTKEQEINESSLLDQIEDLLFKEAMTAMTEESKEQLQKKKEELLTEVVNLQKEIQKLKLEQDIYEKAAELIKKTRPSTLRT